MVAIRADLRIRSNVELRTRELVNGTAGLAAPVAARVVRSRATRNRTGGVVDILGRPQVQLQHAARMVILAALPDGEPPRRVGLLAPTYAAPALTKRSIHLVHLVPGQPEVAVLNVRAEPGRLDAAWQDVRWATSAGLTDWAIAGGRVAATAYGLSGLAVGLLGGLALVPAG